jgi:hypothetical protein
MRSTQFVTTTSRAHEPYSTAADDIFGGRKRYDPDITKLKTRGEQKEEEPRRKSHHRKRSDDTTTIKEEREFFDEIVRQEDRNLGISKLQSVLRDMDLDKFKVPTLSTQEKKTLWDKLSVMFEWNSIDRNESTLRHEIESVFGKPPYEFLTIGPTAPRLTWADGKRRRHMVLAPEYKAMRPSPNYYHFIPLLVDQKGREYRLDDSGQGRLALMYRRPSRILKRNTKKEEENKDYEMTTHPETDEELTLFHLERAKKKRIMVKEKWCPGHQFIVSSTFIMPMAATGVVYLDGDDGRLEQILMVCPFTPSVPYGEPLERKRVQKRKRLSHREMIGMRGEEEEEIIPSSELPYSLPEYAKLARQYKFMQEPREPIGLPTESKEENVGIGEGDVRQFSSTMKFVKFLQKK